MKKAESVKKTMDYVYVNVNNTKNGGRTIDASFSMLVIFHSEAMPATTYTILASCKINLEESYSVVIRLVINIPILHPI